MSKNLPSSRLPRTRHDAEERDPTFVLFRPIYYRGTHGDTQALKGTSMPKNRLDLRGDNEGDRDNYSAGGVIK